jgi:Cu(I)/Ag(I) efflux system membrane fusion protein
MGAAELSFWSRGETVKRSVLAFAALSLGVGAGAVGGYWYASHSHVSSPAPAAGGGGSSRDRRVLYWYDPMYPQSRFEQPGKSPFMDMQLVPKYADEGGNDGTVSVSPRVVQNLGVRTVEVRRGSLAQRLTAVGSVEYNERSFVVVQPRANGFIERLYVRAALDPIRQGDPLVEILFPDWAAAQEEYLLLRKREEPASRELASAARQRLVLLGMSPEQIAAVERAGSAQPRITLRAPVSGVIAELGARQGMTINAGTTLFRIANLGSVWVVAELPEAQANLLTVGSRVEVHVPAYTNEKFVGRVSAILPEVNAATRTVRARIEVANAGGKLKPGMYANLDLTSRGRETLLVPSEAVIRTGERDVVVVDEGQGRFRPVEVKVGAESGTDTEIVSGLKPGDKVVASGQFLIDSEASLRSTISRLSSIDAPTHPNAQSGPSTMNIGPGKPDAHLGQGTVKAVDTAAGRVDLDHGPIPSLKWPAMEMPFTVEDKAQIQKLKPGDKVQFELKPEPNKAGDYVINRITPQR